MRRERYVFWASWFVAFCILGIYNVYAILPVQQMIGWYFLVRILQRELRINWGLGLLTLPFVIIAYVIGWFIIPVAEGFFMSFEFIRNLNEDISRFLFENPVGLFLRHHFPLLFFLRVNYFIFPLLASLAVGGLSVLNYKILKYIMYKTRKKLRKWKYKIRKIETKHLEKLAEKRNKAK